MEYKIVKSATREIMAYIRNGKAWALAYSGFSSPGRDMVKHFSEVLESKGFKKHTK